MVDKRSLARSLCKYWRVIDKYCFVLNTGRGYAGPEHETHSNKKSVKAKWGIQEKHGEECQVEAVFEILRVFHASTH